MKTYYIDSLAGSVVDFYDDPDFIKEATDAQLFLKKVLVAPEDVSKLPDSAFAVKIASSKILKRAFPVYNPQATQASAAFLRKSATSLPKDIIDEAVKEITKAANQQDISIDLQDVNTTTFIVDQGSIDSMSDRLISKMASMDLVERVVNCTNFFKTATASGHAVDEPQILEYAMQDKVGDFFSQGLHERDELVTLSGNSILEYIWSKTASVMADDSNSLLKMISHLEAFDKIAGFESRYGFSLVDPAKTVVGFKKMAETPQPVGIYTDPMGVDGDDVDVKLDLQRQEIMEAAMRMTPDDFSGDKQTYDRFQRDPLAYVEQSPAIKKKMLGLVRRYGIGKL